MLDEDEIDGRMKSLKMVQDKILQTAAANYTEVNFRSRSESAAGCFSKKDTWTTFMKLEKFDSYTFVFYGKRRTNPIVYTPATSKIKNCNLRTHKKVFAKAAMQGNICC